jgi:16S rRNA processing protein RimM
VIDRQRTVLGRSSGAHGVRGWLKVKPGSRQHDILLSYPLWQFKTPTDWIERRVLEAKIHSSGLVARIEGITDRDEAQALKGQEIAIWHDDLPELEDGEYYWSDLIGLKVVTQTGVQLGVLDRFVETGANDVFVVCGETEHWLPYLPDDVVLKIDIESQTMEVNWDPEF